MTDQPGIRIGIAHGALVVVLLAESATRLPVVPSLVLAAVVAGACVAGAGAPAAWWLGLSAWAFVTGFVVHSYGRLSVAGPDLVRLVACLALAYVAAQARRVAR